MSTRAKTNKSLSEQEIDQIVTAQAHDDAAWGKRFAYKGPRPPHFRFLRISPCGAFLAQLHRTKSVEEWLTQVIQECIDLEEAAFVGVKRALAANAA